MDLDLFACDETGVRCIFVEKFPLPRALMASENHSFLLESQRQLTDAC